MPLSRLACASCLRSVRQQSQPPAALRIGIHGIHYFRLQSFTAQARHFRRLGFLSGPMRLISRLPLCNQRLCRLDLRGQGLPGGGIRLGPVGEPRQTSGEFGDFWPRVVFRQLDFPVASPMTSG